MVPTLQRLGLSNKQWLSGRGATAHWEVRLDSKCDPQQQQIKIPTNATGKQLLGSPLTKGRLGEGPKQRGMLLRLLLRREQRRRAQRAAKAVRWVCYVRWVLLHRRQEGGRHLSRAPGEVGVMSRHEAWV